MKATQACWLLGLGTLSCATAGSVWMAEPLSTGAWGDDPAPSAKPPDPDPPPGMPPARVEARVIGEDRAREDSFVSPTSPASAAGLAAGSNSPASGGRSLGTFRNTYYDFPSEADFAAPKDTARSGETVALMSSRCKTIKSVARAFYEAVCVQGSGTLESGSTVSFAKRDCDCAAICPRTQEHICFDELNAQTYPWGRGATGRAIIPLLTVAVDSELIPLDTPLYIPEYDGIARDPSGSAVHDGCFIAQDRGVRVKGQHVDIFTGQREITALWNRLVPSNRGVTVVLDSPHCARAVTRP